LPRLLISFASLSQVKEKQTPLSLILDQAGATHNSVATRRQTVRRM
jgi:hypothetical protein